MKVARSRLGFIFRENVISMENYCEGRARAAEIFADVGLDREAERLLFHLQRCAATSDCILWWRCANRAAGIEHRLGGTAQAVPPS